MEEQYIIAIENLISRIEKIKDNLKTGTPQTTLAERRIAALRLALKAKSNPDLLLAAEEAEAALFQINSIIKKTEKALQKFREDSPQKGQTIKLLGAMTYAKNILENIKKRGNL